jgi:DNA-binding transcriptional ArsR family regulator
VASLRAPHRTRDDELDAVFRALGDRTRRSVLRRLAGGPAGVTELAAQYDMTLPAVSQHLKVLEHAGLIAREIEGRQHWCSLAARRLQEIDRWLQVYRGFWEGTLDALARHVEPHARQRRQGRRRPKGAA